MLLALLLPAFAAPGCRTLSYEEPDAPPAPPPSSGSVTGGPSAPEVWAHAAPGIPWSAHANAARAGLREGDLEDAELEFMATIAATETYEPRDVRRLTALAIPAALVERHQTSERYDDANRIMDAVLAESEGGAPFPVDAWAQALDTRLDVDRIRGGPEAELELAQRIAALHLGPMEDATVSEVRLRQRVGRLLGTHGDATGAATQLAWAARAAEPMLRMPLSDRLGLLYEAAQTSKRAGDPTTSDFLLRDAVALARSSSDPGSVQTAAALNMRGWFLLEQGRPHAALSLLQEAGSMVDTEGTPPVVSAAVLDSLAVALHRVGRLDDAQETIGRAIVARSMCSAEEQAQLGELDDHRRDIERDRTPLEAPDASPPVSEGTGSDPPTSNAMDS